MVILNYKASLKLAWVSSFIPIYSILQVKLLTCETEKTKQNNNNKDFPSSHTQPKTVTQISVLLP